MFVQEIGCLVHTSLHENVCMIYRLLPHVEWYTTAAIMEDLSVQNTSFPKYSFCRTRCNDQWICADLGPWCCSRWLNFGDGYCSDCNCPRCCLHMLEEKKRVRGGQNQWSEQK